MISSPSRWRQVPAIVVVSIAAAALLAACSSSSPTKSSSPAPSGVGGGAGLDVGADRQLEEGARAGHVHQRQFAAG